MEMLLPKVFDIDLLTIALVKRAFGEGEVWEKEEEDNQDKNGIKKLRVQLKQEELSGK